jgi:hypothetical protein
MTGKYKGPKPPTNCNNQTATDRVHGTVALPPREELYRKLSDAVKQKLAFEIQMSGEEQAWQKLEKAIALKLASSPVPVSAISDDRPLTQMVASGQTAFGQRWTAFHENMVPKPNPIAAEDAYGHECAVVQRLSEAYRKLNLNA